MLGALFILIWAAFVLSKSPSGGYAPGTVSCPKGVKSFIREGSTISNEEKDWIKERHKVTDRALAEFLRSVNMTDFDVDEFMTKNSSLLVNIAVSVSGGGYRSMLTGAGQVAALDNRTQDALEVGLGGILQSSTYFAGLSGGAWLVGSLTMQDFASVDQIVFEDPDDLWNLTETRQLPNTTSLWKVIFPAIRLDADGVLSHINNWKNGIELDLDKKNAAGFQTTITDAWGRALAFQLFPKGKDNHGAATTWSDIRDLNAFKNHEMPFPILVSLARQPDSIFYSLNSTVVEANPFEMGSFDTDLNTFVDIKYLGTKLVDGKSNGTCVGGYDNSGFIIGTSSSLFNQFLNTLVCKECKLVGKPFDYVLKPILKRFLLRISSDKDDVAVVNPNPFYHSSYGKDNNITTDESLVLFDGGLGGETIPLSNLMTTERKLDAVFAFDNANWPNGSSLVDAYLRQFVDKGESTVCPYVPDVTSFTQQNLTAKPTFFGCDAKNLTGLTKDGVVPPLVIYLANRPYEYLSNTSTFQMSYTDQEKKAMIQNGFDITSRLNGTIDEEYRACIGCAVIRREQERLGQKQTDQCKKCFQRYCWDGTISRVNTTNYSPPVNFTNSGLTNRSMDVPTLKINESPKSSFSIFSLFRI